MFAFKTLERRLTVLLYVVESLRAGGLLTAVSHFLILGQAALFLLAIRNRLGRRH